jgi:hypothetical protein
MKQYLKKDENGVYVQGPGAVKPGIKSTEAIATLIGLAASIAAATGYLTPAQADTAASATTELVGAAGTVLLPAAYGFYRTLIKVIAIWKGKD